MLVFTFTFQNQKNSKINQFNSSIRHTTLKSSAVCTAYCILCWSVVCSRRFGIQPQCVLMCVQVGSQIGSYSTGLYGSQVCLNAFLPACVFPLSVYLTWGLSACFSTFHLHMLGCLSICQFIVLSTATNLCINLSRCHIAVFMLAFLFYTMFICLSYCVLYLLSACIFIFF